jgi:hypothetical protein
VRHPASTVAPDETPGRRRRIADRVSRLVRPASLRRGRAFLAVPLVLVNLTAVWGQAGWAYDHITHGGFLVALLFALSVESIGVYLAWESHEALMADQASAFLRFGSYIVGALVGVLNYLHFSAQSFAIGVAFGALSAISPWLWGIWSRARNRTRLAELGLVDVRGVKLSMARKLWHPIRSVRVLSWAAWEGVTDPADAVAGWAETVKASKTSTTDSATDGETDSATETAVDDEPEFTEPDPVVSREVAPLPPDEADETPDAVDDELGELLEIERVMAEQRAKGKPVTREIAEVMVRTRKSRSQVYRDRQKGRANDSLA